MTTARNPVVKAILAREERAKALIASVLNDGTDKLAWDAIEKAAAKQLDSTGLRYIELFSDKYTPEFQCEIIQSLMMLTRLPLKAELCHLGFGSTSKILVTTNNVPNKPTAEFLFDQFNNEKMDSLLLQRNSIALDHKSLVKQSTPKPIPTNHSENHSFKTSRPPRK